MMRNVLLSVVLGVLWVVPAAAQDREADLRVTFPYDKMAAQIPGLKMEDYETAIRILAQMPDLVSQVAKLPIRPLAAAPSASGRATPPASVSLYNPPPPRPATPPVPRITYPTTRGIYEWEAAHLRRR
jgi:hypothetical protein